MQVINISRNTDQRRIPNEGTILVGHQPEFMPWLGNLSKATMGDVYFILDDSQYKSKYFENRNKIRFDNKEGWIWLSAPVTSSKSYPNMQDVCFVDFKRFAAKSLKTIENSYRKAPFFYPVFSEIEEVFADFDSNRLVDFNFKVIQYAFSKFNINVPIFKTSELNQKGFNISEKRTELVIQMCKVVGAKVYVQGSGGKDYHDRKRFMEEGINLVFQIYNHPIYSQIHGGFVPYMSFIDLLFNQGTEKSIEILGKSEYEV